MNARKLIEETHAPNVHEQLRQANQLRHTVGRVDTVRNELLAQGRPDHVAIVTEVFVKLPGYEVEDWGTDAYVGARLVSDEFGLVVTIPSRARPSDVRACLERVIERYDAEYEAIMRDAERRAAEVLGHATFHDDLGF